MSTISIGNGTANAYVQTGDTSGSLNLSVANGLINCAVNSGAFGLPAGTTEQRPSSPSNGSLRYNTTTLKLEGYANNTWVGFI